MFPQALLATAIISVFPNLFLFLFPNSIFHPKSKNGSQKKGVNWMNICLCFAVGGLLGDVFLHILPHMLNPHEHNHNGHGNDEHNHSHSHGEIGLVVKGSLNSKSESQLLYQKHEHDDHDHDHKDAHKHEHDDHDHDHKDAHKHEHDDHDHDHKDIHKHEHDDHDHDHKDAHKHEHDDHDHDHKDIHKHEHDDHDHQKEAHKYDNIGVCSALGLCSNEIHSLETPLISKSTFLELMVLLGFFIFFFTEQIVNHSMGHSHSHQHDHHHDDHSSESKEKGEEKARSFLEKFQTISATGFLNLLADTMHNVTDGIAVGAAFAHGSGIGFATFVSVFFHEIPHEIADLIVLVQNGFTKWEAIGLQFITAVGALIGTWIGYQVESNDAYKNILLAIASGGFLYIATVSMVPSIIAEKGSIFEIIMQMISFLAGVGLMVVVLWLEAIGGHSH